MERKADGIGRLAFRSLRLGFAAALLAAGLLPLIAALSVLWHLSAQDAAGEAGRRAETLHGLMVRSLQLTVARLDDLSDRLSSHPVVRSLAEEGVSGEALQLSVHQERMLDIDGLFAEALAEDLPLSGVCFASAKSGLAICSNPSAHSASGSAATGTTRLETHTEGKDSFIRFVKPLAPSGGETDAALVFLLDKRSFLNPAKWSGLKAHTLLDATGRPVIGTEEPVDPAGDGAAGVSTMPVTILSETWTSAIRWEEEAMPGGKRRFLQAAVWSGLLLALLAAGVSILFHLAAIRPLRVLQKLMKRAESGDLKAYWTMPAPGEIRELGHRYNQMLNRIDELIKQVKAEEALKKEKEIEALHYQLNPHFLYNTLNTVKWVAKIHKTPQIADAVSALVRLLQASLGKKGDFLPLGEEIGLVRDYMAIQAFRYGDGITLETDIEPVTTLCLVPKLILQPLVENAIIHGLQQKQGERTIVIRSRLDRDLLIIQVEDNGVGMEPPDPGDERGDKRLDAMERMSGIGLRHIREKLRLYYGPDYPMRIFSKPGEGTRVRLALPIHRSDA